MQRTAVEMERGGQLIDRLRTRKPRRFFIDFDQHEHEHEQEHEFRRNRAVHLERGGGFSFINITLMSGSLRSPATRAASGIQMWSFGDGLAELSRHPYV